METRELLTQLTRLEHGLDAFSFKELKTDEATELKESFLQFKHGFEARIFGEDPEEFNLKESGKALKIDQNFGTRLEKCLNDILTQINLFENKVGKRNLVLLKTLKDSSSALMKLINGKRFFVIDHVDPSSENQLFDFESLIKHHSNDQLLISEMVNLFRSKIFEFIGKTKLHLQVLNYDGIVYEIEKVLPELRIFRANTLEETCECIVFVIKASRNHKQIDQLFDEFMTQYLHLDENLTNQINTLKKVN